uniref:Uncharacterized protein n=1 Tax=Bursaphelenchus xylophilus TaxID=6326 RepID=A0A1I7SNN2_BURXY
MWCCVRHLSGRYKEEIWKFYYRKRALVGSLLYHFAGTDGETQGRTGEGPVHVEVECESQHNVPMGVEIEFRVQIASDKFDG